MKFGWIPDHPDARDIKYGLLHPRVPLLTAILRRSYVDLRAEAPSFWPPTFDQGNLGSCVFNAWSLALAYTEAKNGHGVEVMSRLHPYWHYRDQIHEIGQDTGATIRDAIKTIAHVGIPLETAWPYDLTRWTVQPSDEAEAEGIHRRVGLIYVRAKGRQDILDSIARGWPVVFGTTLFEGFMKLSATSYLLAMPKPSEATVGGHAMVLVGYDTRRKVYKVANSWGPAWGDQGHCYIPFDYIDSYASDFWTARRIAL